MIEPSLKKALEPYLKGLDKDIYYRPPGYNSSALFLAVLYSVESGGTFSSTSEDFDYAKKVVELLLKYGADPDKPENEHRSSTPLELARGMNENGKDPLNIYGLLLKHSLNSVTESVAFEANSIKNGNELDGKLTEALKKLGKLDEDDIKKVKESILNSSNLNSGNLDTKNSNSSNVKGQDGSDELVKYVEGVFNVPELVNDKAIDKKVKTKLGEILVNSDNPYNSPEVKLILSISKHLSEVPSDGKIWGLILNTRFSQLTKILDNLSGLSSKPSELTGQLSYIAYFLSKGLDLKLLKSRDGSHWKSLPLMKKSTNSQSSELTGTQIILESLKKRNSKLTRPDGIKFISTHIFGGNTEKAQKFLDENEDKISKILNKSYRKTFDGDKFTDILVREFNSLLGKSSTSPKEGTETGREIIIRSVGGEGPGLSRVEGIKFLADKLFKGDQSKADEFFNNHRNEVGDLLNKEYSKTFDEDNISDLFIEDLTNLAYESSKNLTPEQAEASLALQGLNFSKKDSLKMVRDKSGSSADIIVEALRGVKPFDNTKRGK